MIQHVLIALFVSLLTLAAPVRGSADATAAATRAAVETVLVEMERAVLAGDGDGYLKHIATDDPVFLQEQRMWAADLKLHVPSVFDLRIIDPAERKANEDASQTDDNDAKEDEADDESDNYPHEFVADRAVFEMEMKWEITVPLADGEEGDPKYIQQSVSYPVVFERRDGRWVYRGERWVEVLVGEAAVEEATDAPAAEGEDADRPARRADPMPTLPAEPAASTRNNIVLCFPGYETVAARIAGVLPDVRAHVDEGFGREVAHRQVVKIYPTMRHLQSSIYLSYKDGLTGWNEPKEAIKVLVRPDTPRASLRTLLAHEYGHCATFELGPKATDIAWWALEGVAELASDGFRRGGIRRDSERVVRWAANDELAPFASIADFRNTPRKYGRHVYVQGHAMVGYIADRFGRDKLNKWFEVMANGATIDAATRDVLGVAGGFGDLDTQWRAELASDAAAEEAQ